MKTKSEIETFPPTIYVYIYMSMNVVVVNEKNDEFSSWRHTHIISHGEKMWEREVEKKVIESCSITKKDIFVSSHHHTV